MNISLIISLRVNLNFLAVKWCQHLLTQNFDITFVIQLNRASFINFCFDFLFQKTKEMHVIIKGKLNLLLRKSHLISSNLLQVSWHSYNGFQLIFHDEIRKYLYHLHRFPEVHQSTNLFDCWSMNFRQ